MDGVNVIVFLEEIIGIFSKNGKRNDYDSFGGFIVYFWIDNINWCLG